MGGHRLEAGDIRIQYTFGGDMASELSNKYEADSDGDILVLLNVEPDSGMKDEGIAREIINRIQKLRKKAQLVPSDEVTVYYETQTNGDLDRVINQFNDFIINTLKAPFKPMPIPNDWNNIIEETQNIKEETIQFVIVSQSVRSPNPNPPEPTTNPTTDPNKNAEKMAT